MVSEGDRRVPGVVPLSVFERRTKWQVPDEIAEERSIHQVMRHVSVQRHGRFVGDAAADEREAEQTHHCKRSVTGVAPPHRSRGAPAGDRRVRFGCEGDSHANVAASPGRNRSHASADILNVFMLKAELHAHTSDDPKDDISYTACDLIDRAAELGYGALAITLHDRWEDGARFRAHAERRNVVIISGIERTIEGRHVLLLNFGAESEAVDSFEALAALRQRDPAGLVIAPHAFYPGRTCLRGALDRCGDLVDAVEFNAYYTAGVNVFNAAAIKWAAHHRKPIVANADVHRLHQLGRTYSLIEADPNPASICAAIKAGKVEIRSEPLTAGEAVAHMCDLLYSRIAGAIRGRRNLQAARPFRGRIAESRE